MVPPLRHYERFPRGRWQVSNGPVLNGSVEVCNMMKEVPHARLKETGVECVLNAEAFG